MLYSNRVDTVVGIAQQKQVQFLTNIYNTYCNWYQLPSGLASYINKNHCAQYKHNDGYALSN